ncbi:MAG: hypothetical protein J5835_00585 [Bacteroidales bacterium]|nr:hypothetical protein [Bacteroidales bacterium]
MSLRDRIRLRIGGRERELAFLLFSLLLAFGIWFFTNLSKTYSGTINVPVIAECNIDGHSSRSSNTVIVSARCRMDGFRLVREQGRAEKKPVTVKFDRGDLRHTGEDSWAIFGSAKNSYINSFFGEGAALEAFITDTLTFVFPKVNHRKVPVEIPVSVQCRSQFMQSGPFKVYPDSVTLYGEDSRLEAIDKITAPRLSFTDVNETRHGVVKLARPKGLRISSEEVTYELPVSRYVELQGTYQVEVYNAPAGTELQVYPSVAKVVLRCAFPLVKDPLPNLRVYIDYHDFTESKSGKCVPRIQRLPKGVLSSHVEPEIFDCIELR